MANTFFQFKQFTIHQQWCAMKVSTDACIFGAVVAEIFAGIELQEADKKFDYVDIGTGTGLLSLLLAQKTTGLIDAIEIEENAVMQASQNFSLSPFKERISIYKNDILQLDTLKKYDGIICNPPFYENDLQSPNDKKNAAKHDTTLTLQQLLQAVAQLLKSDGIFAVLLPCHRVNECVEKALQHHLYLKEKILLRHSDKHPYFRGILFFAKTPSQVLAKQLSIKKENGTYTDEFVSLLKDYYLQL